MVKNSYVRSMNLSRGKEVVVIPNVCNFSEVVYDNQKPVGEMIEGHSFYSFHQIVGTSGIVIMNAFKSKTCPEVLLIEWRDFPCTHHIEIGGDLMLQELKRNTQIKYLLIDNTYLKSGWMNEKITQYFHMVWYPSLIQLGLKGFAHIQSLNSLGGASFEKFKTDVQAYVNGIGKNMRLPIFTYIPVEIVGTKNLNRLSAFNTAHKALMELK